MRITLPHRYDFGADAVVVGGDLGRFEAWDALRTGTTGPFALAGTRADWERQADSVTGLEQRASAIDAWLEARGVTTVASYGVGAGLLELRLHACKPDRRMILGDYTPDAVARLAELFPEADVRTHDLLVDPPFEAGVHLFHRIDTEFTSDQWRRVLERFAREPVLFVAADVLDGPRRLVAALVTLVRLRTATRAGWLRTGDAIEDLFRSTHVATPLAIHDLSAWALEPRPNSRGALEAP